MQPYVVIMAGGSGERFWPLSRMRRPKQLLKLTSATKTMIEEAIARIEPVVPKERILIITSAMLRQPIIEALPGLNPANVIAEPAKRNTAPCLALACAAIRAREHGGNALMAVLTADHFIGDAEVFRDDVRAALDHAADTGALVTMGIVPTRPETGYGYIEMPEHTPRDAGAVHVVSFKEKPSADIALEYMRSGHYLWNSGMFFWQVEALQQAMLKYLPEVGSTIDAMTAALVAHDVATLAATFHALPDISIDYGIMERAGNVAVVHAHFPWDDVGSWDALDRMQDQDDDANVVQGSVHVIDTTSSIIINATDSEHVVTTLGVTDIVVVVTDEATMVCSKHRAQDVKKIVAGLRSKGLEDVL